MKTNQIDFINMYCSKKIPQKITNRINKGNKNREYDYE
jgi:hypothetical protein